MLIKFTVENFLSFYNPSTFDMLPNIKKTSFPNHIYNDRIPVLKQAVIYGANGSGKSNLLDSILTLKKFVTKKDFFTEESFKKYRFRLVGGNVSKPIQFKIELKANDSYYLYEVELNETFINEKLSLMNEGNTEKKEVFSRNDDSFKTSETIADEILEATKRLLKNNKFSSLIFLNKEFPIIRNKHLHIVSNWFEDKLEILSLDRKTPQLIDIVYENKELLNFTNSIFKEIGLGVKSLEIASENLEDLLQEDTEEAREFRETIKKGLEKESSINLVRDNKTLFTIVEEDDKQILRHFVFKQIGIDNYLGSLQIDEQSDGTVKILNLMPVLYDIIKKDKIILIDEIENSIHVSLITELISFFGKSKSKGQLIFTTHETGLLNQKKLMRPDEVWFTEKREGDTEIYSLNDFKEHNTINLRNGYLTGRYGGIPYIGELNELELEN